MVLYLSEYGTSSRKRLIDPRTSKIGTKTIPFANKIKKNTKMIFRKVRMITDSIDANNIIINQDADMVAMARSFLSNPRWVWDAAKVLNHDIEVPPQYARRI